METAHPLTTYRKAHKVTQAGLAEMFDVDRITVARWEAGTRKIGADKLALVSEKTGIPKRELRPDLADLLQEAS